LQGVITVQTYGPRDFTAEEINFVETVAGELAFFIVNAQLYQQTDEQLHQKVRELTTLQQVSKSICRATQSRRGVETDRRQSGGTLARRTRGYFPRR
jgi:GAF domain-containing protein